jgi:hypothetical protein
VVATGVVLRLASGAERQAVARARRGYELEFAPPRSFQFTPSDVARAGGALVVSQAFADVDDGSGTQRWRSSEHHGRHVPTHEDATLPLLRLAQETAAEGLIELLGDMGIAGLGVSRWELMSAPHRIELTADLEAALAPLRRR